MGNFACKVIFRGVKIAPRNPSELADGGRKVSTMRRIFSSILVLSTLLFAKCAFCDDSRDTAINAMKAVLDQDASLSRITSNSASLFDLSTDTGLEQCADVCRNYVSEARKINLSMCPKPFTNAYERNLAAQESLADVLSEHPHIAGSLESLIGFDTSKYQEGFDAWRQRLDAQNRKVKATWNDVEMVFTNYSHGEPIIDIPDNSNKNELSTITNLTSTCADGSFWDTACFINNSGQDLTGVFVAIELTGEGDKMRRVRGEYYWPVWRYGEKKEVGIGPGESLYHVERAILTGDCDQGIIGHGPVHR